MTDVQAIQAIRVIALGHFFEFIPPLVPRLAKRNAVPMRCGTFAELPSPLSCHDIILADMSWLKSLGQAERLDLAKSIAEGAFLIALTDESDRFKDLINWQRIGVSKFFRKPIDPERLAALVEEVFDRVIGEPIRVIILDDDLSSLSYYSEIMRQAGINVLATQDPLLVLDALDSHAPDILLTDIEMPGCRGPELVNIIRQYPKYARLPVIFITAMESLQDKFLARAVAAEDYLAKPVSPELLISAVEAHALRYRSFQRVTLVMQQNEVNARLRQEQMRTTLDEHGSVSITDAQGNITHASSGFCNISGYSSEELIGKNHRLLKSGMHPPEFFRTIWATTASGKTWQGEICNKRKDGSLYWINATIKPFLDSKGKPYQYISIRTDITAQKQKEAQLRLGEQRLADMNRMMQAVVDNIPVRVFWKDLELRYLGCNTVFANDAGYDNPSDIIGKNDFELPWSSKADIYRNDDRDVMDSRSSRLDYLETQITPEGKQIILNTSKVPLFNFNNDLVGVLGIYSDMTERIQTNVMLHESATRLSLAIEGAGDGVWDWCIASGKMLLSAQYEAMLGFAQGELLLNIAAWVESVHPSDISRVQECLQDYLAGKHPLYVVELRLRCKDGSYKWVLCRGTVIERDTAGQPTRMIGIHSDISERKATEEDLALFRRILDASEQGVGVTDSQGRVIYVNQAQQKIFRCTKDDVIGKDFLNCLPEDDGPQIASEIMEAAKKNQSWSGIHAMRRKDGSIFMSSSNFGFIKDELGNIQYQFNIFSDFTENLTQRQELANAKESAERANQAKSDFLSSMSHELRTPMNAVIGFAQMLEYDGDLSEDQQDNVQEITKAGHHLLELINEVLDLAKIESGRIDLSIEAIEVQRLVEDCKSLINPLAMAKNIELSVDVRPNIYVRADRIRLKQVLVNLLSNAVKYNREGGGVSIVVEPSGTGVVRIAITDTGIGIDPEHICELFQPFNRLNLEASDIEGSGIGLTITKRLVEIMGGKVGVESSVGVGSTFWIEVVAESGSGVAIDIATHTAALTEESSFHHHHILCIDDNPTNLKLIAQILAHRAHINLTTAHAPELGIELAFAQRPDLILLDINMPGMGGYQVLKVLKDDKRLRQIPVVAITANALLRDIERGKAAGFSDYLTKPLDIPIFLQTIDRLLSNIPEQTP